jgi:hypothetical protein
MMEQRRTGYLGAFWLIATATHTTSAPRRACDIYEEIANHGTMGRATWNDL